MCVFGRRIPFILKEKMKVSFVVIIYFILRGIEGIVDLTNNFPLHYRDAIEVADDERINGLLSRSLEKLAEEFFRVKKFEKVAFCSLTEKAFSCFLEAQMRLNTKPDFAFSPILLMSDVFLLYFATEDEAVQKYVIKRLCISFLYEYETNAGK